MISAKLLRVLAPKIARRYSSECAKDGFTVTVIGAAGGVGQPLSLLLKLNPAISELRLHDLVDVPGVTADLSHVETSCKMVFFTGTDHSEAICGADVVVVPAGVPRKPGMSRSDLFTTNAQVVYDFAVVMAKTNPGAIAIIITNPVNSVVPVVCEVLQKAGKLDPRKILGCSTLDSVRANVFLGEATNTDPKNAYVPVVGGHSGPTIIPLWSRSNPKLCLTNKKLASLTKRVQEAGTQVVKAKEGKGSATLSTAYAASRLTYCVLRAMKGETNIVESCYVASDIYPGLKYLATPLLLGKNGVEKNLGLGTINDEEKKLFCGAVEELQKDIKTGEEFVKSKNVK
ncbi:malate dehydrogenase, mitochondrial-like [Cylas formicarius]|uniref:malate dehydrogenase, mitochondrial-like n=1 Tax=Cylas formicarius TaxID=197179 RepID=UPI002958CCA9|nr:malate dehydrogenase, mitochondrial-like [Cylas formicarius]